MVVVCLKPESRTYEVLPSGLITGVSESLIIVDVVRDCVCKSSFLILTQLQQKEQQNNKLTKTQFAFSSFSDFGAHCIGPNKKFLFKTKQKYK